jgi:hypothetical protein
VSGLVGYFLGKAHMRKRMTREGLSAEHQELRERFWSTSRRSGVSSAGTDVWNGPPLLIHTSGGRHRPRRFGEDAQRKFE